MVSKIQNNAVTPKRTRLETLHNTFSRVVGKEKLHPATWMAVERRVAKQRQYSWYLYGFMGNRSLEMRWIGHSGGITGMRMNGWTLIAHPGPFLSIKSKGVFFHSRSPLISSKLPLHFGTHAIRTSASLCSRREARLASAVGYLLCSWRSIFSLCIGPFTAARGPTGMWRKQILTLFINTGRLSRTAQNNHFSTLPIPSHNYRETCHHLTTFLRAFP
jgi:hypothetical protein